MNTQGRAITVTFQNGSTYTYNDVPAQVVIGFVSAGSPS
jgi:KTSC domain-containing protein